MPSCIPPARFFLELVHQGVTNPIHLGYQDQ